MNNLCPKNFRQFVRWSKQRELNSHLLLGKQSSYPLDHICARSAQYFNVFSTDIDPRARDGVMTPLNAVPKSAKQLLERATSLELATSTLEGWHSSQLSYARILRKLSYWSLTNRSDSWIRAADAYQRATFNLQCSVINIVSLFHKLIIVRDFLFGRAYCWTRTNTPALPTRQMLPLHYHP